MDTFRQPGTYVYLSHNLIEAVLFGAISHIKVDGHLQRPSGSGQNSILGLGVPSTRRRRVIRLTSKTLRDCHPTGGGLSDDSEIRVCDMTCLCNHSAEIDCGSCDKVTL